MDQPAKTSNSSTLSNIAAFPVDILTPTATYEIQWGSVQRPTHKNTSWDWARFKTCAHKWVDLSEGGYGVSLLNDCKYGHDIHDHVIRLTLLRSPTVPDPMADFGKHQFVYSLLPHAGSWQEGTQKEAYALNDPLICFQPSPATDTADSHSCSFVASSEAKVVIETVKQAEDGDGIIIRLYESHQKRGPAKVRFAFPVKNAWETNLLEENEAALDQQEGQIHLTPASLQKNDVNPVDFAIDPTVDPGGRSWLAWAEQLAHMHSIVYLFT